ncbi:uncharacterized protein LOC131893165 [Tigriopus californicus]|uniref:uncharacterized protein LOC131893165 n=1 Tax=Tigriopus californicus TaxID=6832 RepID=UPI0027D9EFB3|nr:uncharacterized protein LOC131893165 [Tigriopus californicus]
MIVFLWLLFCLVSTGLAESLPAAKSEDQIDHETAPRSLGDMVRKMSEGFGEGENVASIITADLFDAFKSMINYRLLHSYEKDYPDFHQRQVNNQLEKSATPGLMGNLMRMMGYEQDLLGPMVMKLFFYVGELALKSYMGVPKTVEEDIPSYRTLIQENGILSGLTTMIEKSSARAEKVQNAVFDPTLPQDLIEGLQSRTGSATSCVQLFICKMSPVIWKAQDRAKELDLAYGQSLSYNLELWSNEIYNHLPEQNQVTEFGKNCDERFPTCPLIDFTQFLSEKFTR